MKINYITVTGADNSVHQSDLKKISQKYPFVEWGILLSRNSKGQNRFPSGVWLEELDRESQFDMNLAGHLCGGFVREFLMGNTDFISKDIGTVWMKLRRIQINTHGIKHDYDIEKLVKFINKNSLKEFIFQYDNINKEIVDQLKERGVENFSILFDLSHGAGVLPEEWPVALNGIHCGYAGGLSPHNVKQQIQRIENKVDTGREIWIDAETHLRSQMDKVFDLNKVEAFLSAANETGLVNHDYHKPYQPSK